jgi:GNAT superfamily N-acetyltransferase
MDEETYAIYADVFAAMSEDLRGRTLSALSTDQADLVHVVLAVDGAEPVGHAALRRQAEGFEIKKVFVPVQFRGRGISRLLMAEVEAIARELGESQLKLQTGPKQVEAVALYKSLGYQMIDAFEPYFDLKDMIFMGKALD